MNPRMYSTHFQIIIAMYIIYLSLFLTNHFNAISISMSMSFAVEPLVKK